MNDDELKDDEEQDMDLVAPIVDDEEDLDTDLKDIKDPLLGEDGVESLDALADEEEEEMDIPEEDYE